MEKGDLTERTKGSTLRNWNTLCFSLELPGPVITMIPMDTSLRLLRIVWGALLASVAMYVLVGEQVGRHHPTVDLMVFRMIAVVAIVTVGLIFGVRRVIVLRALQTLADRPDDAAAGMRWRGGYIITFALCEAIALYGFVLRILGFTLNQVAPFYIGGVLLLLYFGPRRPASNDLGASASTMG